MTRMLTVLEVDLGPTWFRNRNIHSGSAPGKHSFIPESKKGRAALPSMSNVENGEASGHPFGFKAETPNGTDTLWWFDK